jgi:hypothetical protein
MAAENPTVLNLSIAGTAIPVWYSVPTGGLALSSSTPLSTGTYYAAQIVNSCESSARTSVAVTVNANSVGGSVSSDALVCIGTNSTTLTLSGQTGNVIKWQSANNINFTGTVVNITNTNTTYTVTNINTPTYYRAVVQSGTSTSFSTPAFIDIIPQSIGGSITPSNVTVCSGQNSGLLTLSGHLGAIIRWEESTNGSTWNPIANTNSSFISGALTQTTYFRAVIQNSGCAIVYSTNVVVTINSAPIISAVNLSACVGNNSTLSASTTPAASNAWLSSNPGIATISATGLVSAVSPGTTVITFTNSNGCTATANFVVHVPPTLFVTNPAPVCSPNTVNLTSSNVTQGSTSGLFYSYFTNSIATLSLTNNTAVATSGTYYIKGTDSNGCSTIVKQVTVLINSLPNYTITGNSTICAGSSTTLTSSSANSYSWNNGLAVIGTTSSITVTPLTTTTYTLTGTDNNGCPGTGTFTVTVNPLPNVNAGSDKIICLGSSVTLSGSGASTYTWNNGIPNGNPFNPTSTSTYTVIGTDGNNCTNTDSVLVTVKNIPATPSTNVTQPNCNSTTATIQFTGLPTTGSWTLNPGAYTGNTSTFTLNNPTAGTYNFTVTDNNLCTSVVSPVTIITAPTTPSAPIAGTPSQPSCTNPTGSVTLSGLPTGTWTITKSPGGETYTNTGNTYTVTNLTTGTYTFTVSNGACSSTASSNVVINATPSVNTPIVGLIVQPTCSVATGSVTLSGLPTGSWTLNRLQDNVNFSSNGLSTTIPGLTTGIYNYTVKDANGCVSSNTTNIPINTQPATPVVPIANAQSFLLSDNATVANLVIASAGTPSWYSSASGGTAINSATLLTTGIYYASQTVNGCESSNRAAVNVSVFPNSIGGAIAGGNDLQLLIFQPMLLI